MRIQRAVWMMVAMGVVSVAAAQQHVLDQAVASELLRGATSQMALGALQSNPDLARQYSAGVLEQELVQEAARRGLAERLDVQRAIMMARYQILIQALQGDIARTQPQPTEAEIKRQFEKNRAEYKLPEAVKTDLFVLDGTSTNALDVARAAVAAQTIDPAQLQKTRFQRIAEAAQVWVARDVFPEEVWTEVRAMKKDQVRFFRVPGGNYMLLKYEDYRAERPATLEEATDGIRNQLLNERQQKAWQAYLDQTRKKLGFTEAQ